MYECPVIQLKTGSKSDQQFETCPCVPALHLPDISHAGVHVLRVVVENVLEGSRDAEKVTDVTKEDSNHSRGRNGMSVSF